MSGRHMLPRASRAEDHPQPMQVRTTMPKSNLTEVPPSIVTTLWRRPSGKTRETETNLDTTSAEAERHFKRTEKHGHVHRQKIVTSCGGHM